jgi:hypothetical protein
MNILATVAFHQLQAFDPSQPRDTDGKWSSGGAADRDPGGRIERSIDKDYRYNDHFEPSYYNDLRQSDIENVISYLHGKKPLAEYDNGQYRCAIMGPYYWSSGRRHGVAGTELIFKNGDLTPVPSGKWVDMPDDHWGISKKDWASMPMEDRAMREAREQVETWAPHEYELLKKVFYNPPQNGVKDYETELRLESIYRKVSARLKQTK